VSLVPLFTLFFFYFISSNLSFMCTTSSPFYFLQLSFMCTTSSLYSISSYLSFVCTTSSLFYFLQFILHVHNLRRLDLNFEEGCVNCGHSEVHRAGAHRAWATCAAWVKPCPKVWPARAASVKPRPRPPASCVRPRVVARGGNGGASGVKASVRGRNDAFGGLA
jgi:hypothetical protein